MTSRIVLARQALRCALQLRRALSLPREAPINIFDVTTAVGVDVRFLDMPSLEGMYCRDPSPRILLPSYKHRPRGRIAYSCAHELGHHQFGHGTRVDEFVAKRKGARPPEEFAADVFAGHLLMTRQAVVSAFQKRNWAIEEATPRQTYTAACELGVGYESLLSQMTHTLHLIPASRHDELKAVTPKQIRAELLGVESKSDLVVVDENWGQVPVDLEIGSILLMPSSGRVECPLLEAQGKSGPWQIAKACRQGIGTLSLAQTVIQVRVSRTGYTGPFRYRFLEETGDE